MTRPEVRPLREDQYTGGPVVAEPTRGRGPQALLVARVCGDLRAVNGIVSGIPGVLLRRPFTIPAGSKCFYIFF